MINLENVNKKYGEFVVLEDVNMNINRGEIYGLIGKNGSGKTTIFKIILGLTNFNGGVVSIKDEKDLKSSNKIGFLIGENFFGYLNGKDNLKYHCDLKGIKDKKEIERVLKLVGLFGVNKKYSEYSMGMKKRLGIASAILGNPEILILDEPTNGLDPQGIMEIRHLIKILNEKYDMTIVVSSHILSELQNTANRFGILDNKKIVKEFSKDDLKLDNEIIAIKVSDYEKAIELLKENNIDVLSKIDDSKSLEKYYFELIGEKDV